MAALFSSRTELTLRVCTPWVEHYIAPPLAHVRLTSSALHARVYREERTIESTVKLSKGSTILCGGNVEDEKYVANFTYVVIANGNRLTLFRFEKWRLKLAVTLAAPSQVRAAKLLSGPRLFVVNAKGRAHMLTADDAIHVSLRSIPRSFSKNGSIIAIGDEGIAVVRAGRRIGLLRVASDGGTKWIIEAFAAGRTDVGHVVETDDGLLLCADDGSIECVSVDSGMVTWRAASVNSTLLALTVHEDNVVITTDDGIYELSKDRAWNRIPIRNGRVLVFVEDSLISVDTKTGVPDNVEMDSMMEGDTNEQLHDVCDSLSSRLKVGIERALQQLRIAEDKEMLANEAHSLLRHTLAGTTHVPTMSLLDADMRTLTTRQSKVDCDIDVSITNGTHREVDDADDGFMVLQRTDVSQTIDNAREYVTIVVSGVVAQQALSENDDKPQRVRIDIHVCAAASMCWEVMWTPVEEAGKRVRVMARTPWRGVLAYAAAGCKDLQLQLRLLLEDGRQQQLGMISLLTPAALLQRCALGKCENNVERPPWEQQYITLIADGAEQQYDESIFNTDVCGVSTKTKRAGRMCRIVVHAPDNLSIAAYVASVQQSIPDGVTLRLHATQRARVDELENWARALRAETAAFRGSGACCVNGFKKEEVQALLNKQIALDEAQGACKEGD